MSTNTTNYNLVEPDGNEFYDVQVQNSNMDIIDEEIKNNSNKAESESANAILKHVSLSNPHSQYEQNNKYERIAHRGLSALAPENTLIAMEQAIIYGCDSLEFDMHISNDGAIVISHDDTVDRTTNGNGTIISKTLAQIKTLDAGTKFSTKYTGITIPTLGEILTLARGKVKHIYPEIKGYRTNADIELMINELETYGFISKSIITSFIASDLAYVRTLNSFITLGYLVNSVDGFNIALSLAIADGNAVIVADADLLIANPTLITETLEENIEIIAWTVNNAYLAQSLKKIGVTRLISDNIKEVL
jgi:glycerophosphoryl diester phosphodiesterase